jgi:hypothetical protein
MHLPKLVIPVSMFIVAIAAAPMENPVKPVKSKGQLSLSIPDDDSPRAAPEKPVKSQGQLSLSIPGGDPPRAAPMEKPVKPQGRRRLPGEHPPPQGPLKLSIPGENPPQVYGSKNILWAKKVPQFDFPPYNLKERIVKSINWYAHLHEFVARYPTVSVTALKPASADARNPVVDVTFFGSTRYEPKSLPVSVVYDAPE